jgi:CRISPR-associated protein Cmr6
MSPTLRDEVNTALDHEPADVPGSTHAGLYFDRCSPVVITPANVDERRGQCSPTGREDFINRLEALTVPSMYKGAFERWERALVASGAKTARVKAFERTVIGHGNPSGLEVGLTLHHTYGVPYLPGTALKGLLNHYMATWGVLEPGPDASRWKGVTYTNGRPIAPPGDFHAALFGAPEIESTPSGARRGLVTFEDALYVPNSVSDDRVLSADVVTPHQIEYYRGFGATSGPTEWEEPNPVGFVSVRPGAQFLVAVTSASDPDAAALALAHLLDALETLGVGAKTRAGYGHLERCS